MGRNVNQNLPDNYTSTLKTRLVKTSFKDCAKRLNFLKSLKVMAKNWCALAAHKILL
jgi:hypothetical protein